MLKSVENNIDEVKRRTFLLEEFFCQSRNFFTQAWAWLYMGKISKWPKILYLKAEIMGFFGLEEMG